MISPPPASNVRSPPIFKSKFPASEIVEPLRVISSTVKVVNVPNDVTFDSALLTFTQALPVPLVTVIPVQPKTLVTVPAPAPQQIPSNLEPSAATSRPSTVPVTAILPATSSF